MRIIVQMYLSFYYHLKDVNKGFFGVHALNLSPSTSQSSNSIGNVKCTYIKNLSLKNIISI